MKIKDIAYELVYEGKYKRGAPKATDFVDAAQIDGGICLESKCSNCGHQGMEYHPFVKEGSYRAFAVCPECGEAVEF